MPLIVTIVLDGGLVQDVIVPKELADVQFRIRDYDVEGADQDDLVQDVNGDDCSESWMDPIVHTQEETA